MVEKNNSSGGGMATFFAGLTIGILVGLFIASYLVKLGKMSNKKKAGK